MKLEQTLSHGTYIKEVVGKDIAIPRLNPSQQAFNGDLMCAIVTVRLL
jgi:hypothetical protein